MLQKGIFEDLQRKIDEDTAIKDVYEHCQRRYGRY